MKEDQMGHMEFDSDLYIWLLIVLAILIVIAGGLVYGIYKLFSWFSLLILINKLIGFVTKTNPYFY